MAELRHAVESGLPVRALDAVVRYVVGNQPGAAEFKYRIVPKTTLHRRTRLTVEESQRLERLARLVALAEQVWESPELAREFLAPYDGTGASLQGARWNSAGRSVIYAGVGGAVGRAGALMAWVWASRPHSAAGTAAPTADYRAETAAPTVLSAPYNSFATPLSGTHTHSGRLFSSYASS